MSNNKVVIISLLLNVLFAMIVVYIGLVKNDFIIRVYARTMGNIYVPERHDANCVISWNNCIKQMNYDADIVFFGNSITAGNNWQETFPNYRIVNLGYVGEDTKGMIRRIPAIDALHPRKVFIMAGINDLHLHSIKDFERWYVLMLDSALSALPDANLFVESILPVTTSSNYCSNEKIRKANKFIRTIAEERNITYINLFDSYAIDGFLPEYMSYDGLHLKSEAYIIWEQEIEKYLD